MYATSYRITKILVHISFSLGNQDIVDMATCQMSDKITINGVIHTKKRCFLKKRKKIHPRHAKQNYTTKIMLNKFHWVFFLINGVIHTKKRCFLKKRKKKYIPDMLNKTILRQCWINFIEFFFNIDFIGYQEIVWRRITNNVLPKRQIITIHSTPLWFDWQCSAHFLKKVPLPKPRKWNRRNKQISTCVLVN